MPESGQILVLVSGDLSGSAPRLTARGALLAPLVSKGNRPLRAKLAKSATEFSNVRCCRDLTSIVLKGDDPPQYRSTEESAARFSAIVSERDPYARARQQRRPWPARTSR
jgi:hypothetical protein